MSRDISADFDAALETGNYRPFFAVSFEFDSGEINLWTGLGTLVFQGKSFIGTGSLLAIGEIKETSDLSANGLSITLSGVPEENQALVLSEPVRGRPATLYLGLETDTGRSVLTVVSAEVDTTPSVSSGSDLIITANVEPRLTARLNRAPGGKYTDAWQQARYPGDRFFSFINDLQDKEIVLQ